MRPLQNVRKQHEVEREQRCADRQDVELAFGSVIVDGLGPQDGEEHNQIIQHFAEDLSPGRHGLPEKFVQVHVVPLRIAYSAPSAVFRKWPLRSCPETSAALRAIR